MRQYKLVITNEPWIARALFKTVYLGRWFYPLPHRVQKAALAHEEGHVVGHHTLWRIVCILLTPVAFVWLCRQQEFWADAYAVRKGYGEALLKLLEREHPGSLLSPSHADRRKKMLSSFVSLS